MFCCDLLAEERLMKELEAAREARRAVEKQREELVKKAKLMQTKTQNRRNHGKFDRSHFWLELFLWVLLLCNPCVNLPKSWFKRGSWETLNPKVCIEVFDFFFSSYFVNVSSEFNQVIFWSCFMQYEWDILYLLIVTLSADVLVLVLGVVMETVNEYLIVNICCHRISYWHIFVCAICFGLFFWREELCLHSGKLTSGMLLRTRFLCRVLWRVLILS